MTQDGPQMIAVHEIRLSFKSVGKTLGARNKVPPEVEAMATRQWRRGSALRSWRRGSATGKSLEQLIEQKVGVHQPGLYTSR
jgi:kynureninase